MRGIIIAGTHSGCGKTTVTLGILAALKKKGLVVQPFKAGPDFIDAGLHRLVVERPSRNLDQWMCGREYVIDCFRKLTEDADIGVIEGVMGMYDGDFNAADLARLLQVPVILVVDAYGMAESAGAVVKGFVECGVRSAECGLQSRNPDFGGVIFNRVASEGHYKRLKDSVRDTPVLGYLSREMNFEIPHRHLGLQTAEENPIGKDTIDKLADTVLSHIDLDSIVRNAGLPKEKQSHCDGAKDAREILNSAFQPSHEASRSPRPGSRKFKLAVAYDRAFCFYYEDNLDLLRAAGVEIVPFSPLRETAIPAGADAVYLGGGYPELHAEELSRNTSMLDSVLAWADAGRPMYAECGGLMYLSAGISDFDNNFFPMAAVFPFETKMRRKPRLAYRAIVLNENCILGKTGEACRGHEFHYSDLIERPDMPENRRPKRIYSVKDKNGINVADEGFTVRNTLASYIHVHFGSNPVIAARFAAFSGQKAV